MTQGEVLPVQREGGAAAASGRGRGGTADGTPDRTVMVAVPLLLPRVTVPFSSTVATSVSLLVQVMVPLEPAGRKVALRVTGSG